MKRITAIFACLTLSAAAVSPSFAADNGTGAPYPADMHYGGTGQTVLFSHKAHVSDFGLACDGCHTTIFDLKFGAAGEKGDFTMASLNTGKYCGACHDGNTAFSTDDFSRCDSCHSGSPGEAGVDAYVVVAGPAEDIELGSDDSVALFKHPAHGRFACSVCHTALFPMKKTSTITGMDEINAGKSCGSCHDGRKAFDASDCGKCHPKM